MEKEIERIRQTISGTHIEVNKVEILGHKPRFLSNERGVDSDKQSDSDDDRDMIKLLDRETVLQPIKIDKVVVSRKVGEYHEDGSDSEHSYKFVFKKAKPIDVIDLNKIRRVQALIRGWLARKRTREDREVLFMGVIEKTAELFRVKLIKFDFLNYELSVTSLKTKDTFKRSLDRMPFEEEQTGFMLRLCLVIEHSEGVISDARFEPYDFPEEPEMEEIVEEQPVLSEEYNFDPEHLFIVDYRQVTSPGTHLIYEFKLRKQFPCKLSQVNEKQKSFYKVEVNVGGDEDWLKFNKLPVKDMLHMAYYLDDCVTIQYDPDNTSKMSYVSASPFSMTETAFERKMATYFKHYFGEGNRPEANSEKLTEQRMNKHAKFERRDGSIDPKSDILRSFKLNREGIDYTVDLVTAPRDPSKMYIALRRTSDPTDKDYMKV